MTTVLLTLILELTAAQPRVLNGIVRDPAGKPVESAKVFVIQDRDQRDSIATGVSAADGSFQVKLSGPKRPFPATVLVYRQGFALAGASNPEPPDSRLEIKLEPPTPATVRFVGPDGAPLADAEVTIEAIHSSRRHPEIPDELRKLLAVRTDAAGMATLNALAAKERPRLAVHTKTLGKQVFYWRVDRKFESGLTLRCLPVGSLSGRLIADDPRAVANVKLDVRSYNATANEELIASGSEAQVQTDDQGRFHVSALAAGKAGFRVAVHESLPFRMAGEDLTSPTIEPGKEATVEIALQRAVRVHGLVVDEETGKPIAGIKVWIYNQNSREEPLTDAAGKFEALTAPGNVLLGIRTVPEGYVAPNEFTHQFQIPATSRDYAFDTIRLRRSASLRGIVVDEKDRPVAQAKVAASWMHRERGYGMLRSTSTATNERGEFTPTGIPRDAQPKVTAWTDDRAPLTPADGVVGSKDPLRLKIVPEGVVIVAGRVVTDRGKPVPHATVRFHSLSRDPQGNLLGASLVPLGNADSLRTDAEGRFRTPGPIRRLFAYNVAVSAPGMQPQQLDKLEFRGKESVYALPDVVLKPERSVRGTVVDRQNRPLAGATVFTFGRRTSATTDKTGAFTLTDGTERDVLVFATALGYRTSGAYVAASGGPVTISMTAITEPQQQRIRPVPRDFPKTERDKLLAPLLLAALDRATAEKDKPGQQRALNYLADVDPKRVLNELRAAPADGGNSSLLGKLYARFPDESLALIEALPDEMSRSWAFRLASTHASDPQTRKQLLSQALLAARGVADPVLRALSMAAIGEQLCESGDAQAGERLIRESADVACNLGKAELAGHARGSVAAPLAVFDLPAALKLIEDLKDPREIARYTGNIARRLAEKAPAEAERLLTLVREDYLRGSIACYVCPRMASADLARACKIVAGLGEMQLRGLVYGRIARDIADRDRAAARKLLDQAFAQFELHGRPLAIDSYSWGKAAALLWFAESIAPEDLDHYFWKTFSLYPALGEQHFTGERQMEEDRWRASLAAVLARYQPTWAREIFAPVVERIPQHSRSSHAYHANPIFLAFALLEPQKAVATYREILGQKETHPNARFTRPWPSAAAILSATDEQIGSVVLESVFRVQLSEPPE